MKTKWLAYVKDEDARKEIELAFNSGALLRKRLAVMLKRKQRQSYEKSFLEDGYDTPNWALKQADARGYERAIEEIISLLD